MLQELIAGFDQEAAAAVMARLVSFKMETEVSPAYFALASMQNVITLCFISCSVVQ